MSNYNRSFFPENLSIYLSGTKGLKSLHLSDDHFDIYYSSLSIAAVCWEWPVRVTGQNTCS